VLGSACDVDSVELRTTNAQPLASAPPSAGARAPTGPRSPSVPRPVLSSATSPPPPIAPPSAGVRALTGLRPPSAAFDSQMHIGSCDECAESERSILDIKCGVELNKNYEVKKSSSSRGSSRGSSSGSSSDGGVATAAASNILRARLQIEEWKHEITWRT